MTVQPPALRRTAQTREAAKSSHVRAYKPAIVIKWRKDKRDFDAARVARFGSPARSAVRKSLPDCSRSVLRRIRGGRLRQVFRHRRLHLHEHADASNEEIPEEQFGDPSGSSGRFPVAGGRARGIRLPHPGRTPPISRVHRPEKKSVLLARQRVRIRRARHDGGQGLLPVPGIAAHPAEQTLPHRRRRLEE